MSTGITLEQGDDHCPAFFEGSDFASTEDDLHAVIVADSGTVEVRPWNPGAGLIHWSLTAQSGAPPSLSTASGLRTSFEPSTPGNFLLSAWADANHTMLLASARIAIVGVDFISPVVSRLGKRYFATGFLQPVSGMSIACRYRLIGGGPNKTLGTSKIALGNVGNLLENTLRVPYPPDGSASDYVTKQTPLLDSVAGILRGRSTQGALTPDPQKLGSTTTVRSGDSPEFFWAEYHPATRSRAGAPTGGYLFSEHLVGLSTSFPSVVKSFFQAEWLAQPCAMEMGNLELGATKPSGLALELERRLETQFIYSPPGTPQPPIHWCGREIRERSTRDELDLSLGQVVGSALAGLCDIVFGELISPIPAGRGMIELRVHEVLHGSAQRDQVIRIPYEPVGTSAFSGDRLAHSWLPVRFRTRTPVIAVILREVSAELGLSGKDPALVTSSEADFSLIRSLIEIHQRLSSPAVDDLTELIANRDVEFHAAVTGYAYSMLPPPDVQPEAFTEFLFEGLKSQSLPGASLQELAEQVSLAYVTLDVAKQAQVIDRLNTLGLDQDKFKSFAGFRGLDQLLGFEHSISWNKDLGMTLYEAYQKRRKQGLARQQFLESALMSL